MKILFDASTLVIGGGLSHLKELLLALPPYLDEDECFVLCRPSVQSYLEETLGRRFSAEALAAIQWVTYPEVGSGLLTLAWRSLVYLPRMLRKYDIDVLVSLTGFGTFLRPCRELLLVPNALRFCSLAEAARINRGETVSLRSRLRYWHGLASIRFADKVMFPTESMKQMVQEHLDLSQKPSAVLHFGRNEEALVSTQKTPLLEQIKSWKQAGEQILLHVSTFAFHKNAEVVLEALPEVLASGTKLRWITTFDRDNTVPVFRGAYDAFFRRVEALGLSDVVFSAGHVPHEEIHHYYDLADVFVFPSYTESFGLPLLEAMAASLPVVASGIPTHREVGADACLYFSPLSSRDCARALKDVFHDPSLQAELRAASARRAADFSWSTHARCFLDEIREMSHRRSLRGLFVQREP